MVACCALESQFGSHLVFKGGTALSKAYNVIRRFSEDVDLTYDIRALAPQMVGNAPEGIDAIPPSEAKRRSGPMGSAESFFQRGSATTHIRSSKRN